MYADAKTAKDPAKVPESFAPQSPRRAIKPIPIRVTMNFLEAKLVLLDNKQFIDFGDLDIGILL